MNNCLEPGLTPPAFALPLPSPAFAHVHAGPVATRP